MVVTGTPGTKGPMRRLFGWFWRLFARPRPARPGRAPAPRRPSFEGLEERRMLAAGVSAVLPMPAPPTRDTLLTRLDPANLRTIEVGVQGSTSWDDILLGPDHNGSPSGAFVLTGPRGGRAARRVLVVVHDFTGDGLPDLAIHFGSAVQVRLGQADGSFRTAFQVVHRALAKPFTLAVGDFSGDGRTDLLAVSRPVNGPGKVVGLFLGNGNGTFTPVAHPPAGPHLVRAALGRAAQAGELLNAVWWRDRAAPVMLTPAETRTSPDLPDPRPFHALDAAASRATPDSDPTAEHPPAVGHPADPDGNPGDSTADPGPSPPRSGTPAEGRRSDPSTDGGGAPAHHPADGSRPDPLTDPTQSPAVAASAGGFVRTASLNEAGAAGTPAVAVADGTSGAAPAGDAEGDLASRVALGQAPDALAPTDRAQAEDRFWNLFADEVRRVGRAGAAPGTLAALGQPAAEVYAPRWHAAGLGGLLAQAFYLGSLKEAGARAEVGAAAVPGIDDAQMLLADLTQRLTEVATRLVQSFYLHFLGRAATAGEAGGWAGMLLGGQTEEQVLSAFLSTAEFYRHAAGLRPTGTADERFIHGLYTLLLGRPADDAELGAWLGALPTLGRGGVASAVLGSAEFRGRRVEAHFQDLLQRPPSPAELAGWVNSPFDLGTIRALLEANLPAPANA